MSARSTQQLVFEGPDPERLLLEAWGVHGTQVRISEPVTVRRGGFLGFFAKVHYRIEVLPTAPPMPEEAAPAAPPAAVAPAPTSQALLAAAPARSSAPLGRSMSHALDALLAETQDIVELGTSSRGSFDQILEKVASSLGEDPSRTTLTAPVPPAGPSPATGAEADAAAAGETASVASASLTRPVLRARPWAPPEPTETASGPEPEKADLGRPAGHLAGQLALAGFPAALLADAETEPASLAEAFALVPAPRALPSTPGSLVAVVGDAARSLQLAKALAAQLGLDPGEIGKARRRRTSAERAGHLVVHDATEAADLSPGWRRDRVGIVAVAVAPQGRDAAWARAILRALAPSATLALASATTKPEDIAAWCGAMGGVDSLLLEDLELTLTPASALSTGLPVASLDGVPAHTGSWAAVAARALARREEQA